jgi:hypothetical protein
MLGIISDRLRFFALLATLAAVVSLAPVLLAQGGVQCGDQVVSSFDECQQLMKDSQGGAVEDGDGEAMEQRRRGGGDGVFR